MLKLTAGNQYHLRMSNVWKFNFVLLLVGSVVSTANAEKRPVAFGEPLIPDSFDGTWISDTEYSYLNLTSLEVLKYNVETGKLTTAVNSIQLVTHGVMVTFSADGKWVAIMHFDAKLVFRYSLTAKYTLLELETGATAEVAGGQYVQLMVWAPVGHAFAFVQDNDLFYQSVHLPTPNTQRITDTPNDVLNGIADWIYEEEVLEDTKGLWFSPDGKKMVFISTDDANVHNLSLWRYNDPGTVESQYVEQVVIKYPKAGTTNPTVTLMYADLEKTPIKYQEVMTPVDIVSTDNILRAVVWADNTHFSATWLTRLQTKAAILLCNSQDLKCTQILKLMEDKGWLDIKRPVFKNQTTFFTVLPRNQGPQYGNYRQLCLVSSDRVLALTSGLNVVVDILAYDKETDTIYYTSTANNDSAEHHVYAMSDDGRGPAKCLTCQNGCRYGAVTFSHGNSYYTLSCLGPNPETTDLYRKDGRLVKSLVDNKAYIEQLKNVDLPVVKNLDVPVANGFVAKVRMYLPSSVQENATIKYPVLFNVYAGPDSNRINDVFKTPAFDDYLITSRGIIVVYVDGRGSGLRGDKIKFEMYHKLGGPEIDDILTVAKYLQTNLPYVDANRTAIWGWSYGGYATAMTLGKDTDQLFKCGLAVAPVTNWLYYDSVYTERYMGLPTYASNLEGYKAGDVLSRVHNFRHKLFYLIHGNFDDNVHYQQSMALSKALQHADILFYQQSYPDEAHGLAVVRTHLFLSMDKFWTKCFRLKKPVYKETHMGNSREFSNIKYDYINRSGIKTNTWKESKKIILIFGRLSRRNHMIHT